MGFPTCLCCHSHNHSHHNWHCVCKLDQTFLINMRWRSIVILDHKAIKGVLQRRNCVGFIPGIASFAMNMKMLSWISISHLLQKYGKFAYRRRKIDLWHHLTDYMKRHYIKTWLQLQLHVHILLLDSQQDSVAQWKSAWLRTEGSLVLIPLPPCTFLQYSNFMSFMYEMEVFELYLP